MNNEDYKHLRAEPIIETVDRLSSRIVGRFPEAGLGKVAVAVAEVTRGAAEMVAVINRPAWGLRISLLIVAGLIVGVAATLVLMGGFSSADLDVAARTVSGAAVWLSAVGYFFWTLETRLKRNKAVTALHQLRGLAHIIDMHQLTKDPECGPGTDPAYKRQDMAHYLSFCSELLAILSKVGQLYVEDFPDATTMAAVDQLENLTTGLSQKIWQKLMIIEQIDTAEAAAKASVN